MKKGSQGSAAVLSSAVPELPERSMAKQLLGRMLFGLAVFAAFWLTVPVGSAERPLQLGLGALAVGGMLIGVRIPLPGTLLAAAATAAGLGCGVAVDPFLFASAGVFALAERRGTRRIPWWLLVIGVVLAHGTLVLGGDPEDLAFLERTRILLLSAVILAVAWVLGVRTRHAREMAGARARSEERLRLARDVHDALSHSLSAIGVQAGVAAHVETLGEPELRTTLREIEAQSRDSLAELKMLLHRERAEGAPVEPGSATPLPLSAALRDLVRTAERTGLRAELDCSVGVDELPAAVRITVHRMVQEAITNTLRHSTATELMVTVTTDGATLEVAVSDNGHGAPSGFREGHGLRGMRERVELLGGDLRIEGTGDGVTVGLQLPLPGADGVSR